MEIVLAAIHVFIAVVLIFLVLLHSGKDAGRSGMAGIGGTGGSTFGGALVEKNLDRWTIGFAIAFFITTAILIKI